MGETKTPTTQEVRDAIATLRPVVAERERPDLVQWLDDLADLLAPQTGPVCSSCGRARTAMDAYDYNPLQVVTGQPLGWYSGDDAELCPVCMARILREQ